MALADRSLRRVARGASALAGLAGAYGFLSLMGAFGPVSCWTGRSVTQTSSGETTTEVSHGCEAGVDYLLGRTAGNAPVLFFWAMVLLGLVALGGYAAWTGRRRVVWSVTIVGVAITILGAFSVGWYFLLPTLGLLVAATARSAEARP